MGFALTGANPIKTMHLPRQLSSALTAVAIAVSATVSAHAVITPIGSFTGTYSETFESFPNYAQGPFAQPNGTAIMGGFATMSALNNDLIVYQPGWADFGLATAYAGVSDGSKGLGLNSSGDSVTFAFSSGITTFGGYFGAAYGYGFTGNISFGFSDGSTAAYTYSGPGGALAWQGFSSTISITSATVAGDYLVMDGLQAGSNGPNNVPDGGATIAMLGAALAGLSVIRRKR
jgi:hypothetical protein